MLITIIAIFLAYCLGSLSTAIIVSKFMGLLDPREQGSKNAGATNMLRSGNKLAALFTLIGDTLKGVVSVVAAKLFFKDNIIVVNIIMLAVFIGHLYPLFFGFKGGKGVATMLGVWIGYAWPIALQLLGIWLIIIILLRVSSLAAILTAIIAPLCVYLNINELSTVIVTMVMSIWLIWKHKENIKRLLNGTESKISFYRNTR